MDIPAELLFFLVLIVLNAVAGLFGKKKKGPTGETLPPVEKKRPRRERPARSRPTRSRETTSGQESERWRLSRPGDGSERSDAPWWEQDATPGGGETRSAPSPASADDRPWWETPETTVPGRGDESEGDPWRDDPHRPTTPREVKAEDLWAVLTGGSLPFPVETPPGRHEPEPEWTSGPGQPRETSRGEVLIPGAEYDPYADDPRAPRPEPLGDAAVVSLEGESLEKLEISSEARHEEFHRKYDQTPVRRRRVGALDRLGLGDVSDVRRAIVLAEVLGKPRGL